MEWDYNNPYIQTIMVMADDIDVMGHVNNVIYLRWLERVAWTHSETLGMNWEAYLRLNRALVARRHEIDYLAAAKLDDELELATWLVSNDGKLSVQRAYQIRRVTDGVTVLRGLTTWVCIDLKTGKPKRQPPEFIASYQVTAQAAG